MKVSIIEADDLEITMMEEKEQCLGMFLKPGTFELGMNRSCLTKGIYSTEDMFVFPRHRRVFVRRVKAAYMVVRLSDASLQDSLEQPNPSRIHCQKYVEDKRLRALILAINEERLAGFPSGQLFLDSIDLAIGLVLRQSHSDQSISTRSYRNGLAPYRLRKVIELINENIQGDLSLQKLADTAGLSISHFSLVFKTSTGLSPHQFLLRRKVHMARDLLLHSNAGIRDVAYACGFKTHQHFARAFRKEFRINPIEYRNNEVITQYEKPALDSAQADDTSVALAGHWGQAIGGYRI